MPQKMSGFVRLFCRDLVLHSHRFGTASRRFLVVRSLFDSPQGHHFKCAPCRRVRFQICPRRKPRLGENPQATRDNLSRFRAPNTGRRPPQPNREQPPSKCRLSHASLLVRLSASRQNREDFHTIIRAHSSSWGTLSKVARCDKLFWG